MKDDNRFKHRLGVVLLIFLICSIGVPAIFSIKFKEEQANRRAIKTPALQYGYAAPTIQPPGVVQISEFNSFIGHSNTVEVYNTTEQQVTAVIDVIDSEGNQLFDIQLTLAPRGAQRLFLDVGEDVYGTLVVNGDGVVFRNYMSSKDEYVLTFTGK